MVELTITLRQILDAGPCYDPRDKGLLPPDFDIDAPIRFSDIYSVCGYADTVWCFTATVGIKEKIDFMRRYISRITYLLPESLRAHCESLLGKMNDYVDGFLPYDDLLFDIGLYSEIFPSIDSNEFNSYYAMQAAHVTLDMTRLEISSLRAAEALAWAQTEQAVMHGAVREGLYSRFLGMAIEEQINDLFEIMGFQ